MDNIKLLNVPYGASELKAAASKNTFRGFISALLIYAFVAGGIILKGYIDSTAEIPVDESPVKRIITIDDLSLPSFTEPEKPDEPLVETRNVPLKDDEAMTPVPTSKTEAEISTTRTQDELDRITTPVSKDGEEGIASNNTTGTVITRPEVPVVEEVEPVKPPAPVKSNYEPYEVQKTPIVLNLNQVQGSMQYPQIAIQQEIEDRVSVKVLVGKDGSVIRIGGMSGNSIFHDEVSEKIEGLRFEPAIVNGQAVNCWVTVPFNFKLKNKFGN